MRLVAFQLKDETNGQTARVGALLGDGKSILDFSRALETRESGGERFRHNELLSWFDLDGPLLPRARAVYEEVARGEKEFGVAQEMIVRRENARLLAPVPRPGKIICIGLNYRDHAAESKMPTPERPVVFSKFTTAVVGPDEPIVVPEGSERVDYEAELAVVIGRRAKRATRERAFDYVLGYTNFNDVSERSFQFADGQWQRGKSCDTFAPCGPFIATADEVPDPHKLAIRLLLNGVIMQDSNTENMIFGVAELIAFTSETITLEPGDVIATGTPSGVGFARKPPVFLKRGDLVEVRINGLGTLSNPIH